MGVKGQKMAQDEEKILSVAVDISGTIYHMIFFSIFQILIPWVVKGGGGAGCKRAKKLHILGMIHHMIFIYGTHTHM